MKKHVWTCENGKDYYPSRAVVERMPEGFYMSKYSQEYGSYFSKIESKLDDSLNVATSTYNSVKKDFDKFWSMEDKYKSSGIEFKRAILLHGQPGNGKKYIAKRIGEYFVEKMKGLVFYAEDPEDVKKGIKHLRNVEGDDRKVLIIIEDLGLILEKYGVTSITTILKGITNDDGVYIIGTTNFEDRFGEYISDKPRMIGAKFLVDYPTGGERTKYIKEFAKKLDIEVDAKKISKDTDTLSIGHIRGLIESHFIFDNDYDELIEELKEMKENIQTTFYANDETPEANKVGFG